MDGPSCEKGVALKDVLDLLEEFCRLNEARIESRGRLPHRNELRWRELKVLYDRLMSRGSGMKEYQAPSFVVEDVRKRLSHRGRLRVPTSMEVFFRYKGTYFSSRLVNLSRGGLFMSSNILLTAGSPIIVYLPNLGESYEDLFETRGEVAWSSKGSSATNLPRGMGICFRDMKQRAAEQLDTFLIQAIHQQL